MEKFVYIFLVRNAYLLFLFIFKVQMKISRFCSKFHYYCADENEFASFLVSELRVSKDWVNGRWQDVKDAASISERLLTAKNLDNIVEESNIMSQGTVRHGTCAVPRMAKDPRIDESSGQVNKSSESGHRTNDDSHQKNTQSGLSRSFLGEQLDIYRDKENKSAREVITSNGVKWKVSRKRHREVDASVSARSEKLQVIGRRDPMSTLAMDHLQGREIPSSDSIQSNKKKESRKGEMKRSQPGHHEQSKPINGTPVNGSLFSPVSLASLVMSR